MCLSKIVDAYVFENHLNEEKLKSEGVLSIDYIAVHKMHFK